MLERYAYLVLVLGLVAVPVLILLTEVAGTLRDLVRRWRGSEESAASYGAFSLRRPESGLRARHRHRVPFTSGRPSEIVRHQVEPHVR